MSRDEIVKKILQLIYKRRIFIFEGDLGVGKTTLIKIIAKKIGIKENLKSPTFVLWQKYKFKFKNKSKFLNHLDLYRLKTDDILNLDFYEEIKNRNNIFFIEWGGKLKPFLTKRKIKFVEVIINKINKKHRDYYLKIK